jgi:hypothetical protein
MNLKDLNKEELLKIKEEAELLIKNIEDNKSAYKVLKQKGTLSNMKNGDNIFYIDFNGSKIFNIGFDKITFYKKDDPSYKNYTSFTAANGLTSAITDDCLYRHYFLIECCSNMYFYTLKPENWINDLNSELTRLCEVKKKKFDEELITFKDKINSLIDTDQVDTFIKNLK